MTYGDIQTATPEAERRYYVYMWFEEINGETVPVYIGMGSGNRWRNRTGRSKRTAEYLKTHDCKPQLLVQNLALVVAGEMERAIKAGFVERGIEILDGEHDREQRRQRQKEGINAMLVVEGKKISRKTGNAYGRPKREIDDFPKYFQKTKKGLLTVVDACAELGISRTQWYRLVKNVS
jgi:hypothetical protein